MFKVYRVVRGRAIPTGQQRKRSNARHQARMSAHPKAGTVKLATALAAFWTLSACTITPDRVFTHYDHISHVEVGYPFNDKPEQVYDGIGVTGQWRFGKLFYEAGLSYKLSHDSMWGSDCVFTGRIGYDLWSSK